ncbi:hypothetical protein FEM03_03080 [Phragmitibacter flavus]|uniref:Uncharacterized protein n=1 Tax=Phragmitibacter flavus TaxID=2576071 RepID=A0A5R8KJ74_9BACT|nr:hypothetical protein [Phragmitibacter flavus]TLD72354.1 hypothetical protein FEM03_03080 [Phragmitibacter flavus]
MNRTLARLSSTFLGLLLLNSCESTSGGAGAGGGGGASGETIRNPTVSDMERIDGQMGLQPRQVRPRMTPYDAGSEPASYSPAPAPAAAAPPMLAPEPEPLQDTSSPPPQPAVDPATLQKLR